MLSLDSPRWAELDHAYGKAGDIPALLRQLKSFPTSEGRSEPWFTDLEHSGTSRRRAITASFAAVPTLSKFSQKILFGLIPPLLLFRRGSRYAGIKMAVEVPLDLEPAYLEALRRLPSLFRCRIIHRTRRRVCHAQYCATQSLLRMESTLSPKRVPRPFARCSGAIFGSGSTTGKEATIFRLSSPCLNQAQRQSQEEGGLAPLFWCQR